MRRLLRDNACAGAFAAVGLTVIAWLGLYGFAWSDYDIEVAPAYAALAGGHLKRFLALSPAYGGSLVLRAPFALLPGLWGGGELAIYRAVAVPCLLAAGAFGVWLVAQMRAGGQSRLARATALGLCVASPVTVRALEIGHPEEILGAVLCVSALLVARAGRAGWAGLLLGLALATKAWALLAVLPVLCALPARRWRMLVVAGVVTALVLAPISLVRAGHYVSASGTAAQTGSIFQPWQAWWWLGSTGKVVRGVNGDIHAGYRTPPGWLSGVTHPLIVLLCVPLTVLWLRRRARRPWEPLGLLTLLLLVRCVLDPWNNVYYALPFLFALVAWEALSRRGPPVLALICTALVWITFQELPGTVSADVQSALYLAWSLPLLAGIALWLYAAPTWTRLYARVARRAGGSSKAARAVPTPLPTPVGR